MPEKDTMAGRARKASAKSLLKFWRSEFEAIRGAANDQDLIFALYVDWLERRAITEVPALSEKARNIWLSKRVPDWESFTEVIRLALEELAFEGVFGVVHHNTQNLDTSPQRGGVQGESEQVRARDVVARDVQRARVEEGV